MPKTPPVLGHTVDDPDTAVAVAINLEELIGTDTCVIAKKGFGKSGLLRVLFEQTRPLIQQIIIDPEGEFYTLREKAEYLVAGGDEGDCPATPANAAGLARMLMENPGVSAVIQLDHLVDEGAPELFVRLFIEELMRTPKQLWHPVLICVDETQRFCPQDGVVDSSAAMKDLTRRGRKRGITPVFATLRNAAINKDLTDGVSNWFFGRVGTDIDRRLVANALAFPSASSEAKGLPTLPKRVFWAVGPAVSDQPVLFHVSDAQTTIVKSGGALVAMPPPPKSLQKLLQALSAAAAPAPAEEPGAPAERASLPDLDAIRKETARDAYQQGVDLGMRSGHRMGSIDTLKALAAWLEHQKTELAEGREIDVGVDDRDLPPLVIDWDAAASEDPRVAAHLKAVEPIIEQRKRGGEVIPMPERAVAAVRANPAAQSSNTAGLAMLEAVTKHHPMKLTWAQVAGFTGRKARGGSFNTAKRWLLDNELVTEQGEIVTPTAKGLQMKPAPEQGVDKIQSWANILPTPADQLLLYLVDHPGQTPEELAAATGRQPKGGSWNTAMRHLKANDLVQEVDGRLSPSAWLFD